MTMIIHKKDIVKAVDGAEDYLEFSDGKLKTIDKNITIESEVEVKGDSFNFIVDAKTMKKAIQYSHEIVMIENGNDSININESFKINAIPQIEDEFDVDFENEISIKNLPEMIRKTTVFVEDDTRAHFASNRMICAEGQFRIESNSTGCGIICSEENENEFESSLILRKDLRKLSFIKENSKISRSRSVVSINSGSDRIQLRQVEGEYPAMAKLLTQKEKFKIKLSVKELQQAVKENILFYDKYVFSSEAVIGFDMLYLKTNNDMMGNVIKKIKIGVDPVRCCLNEVSIGFNLNYLNAFLNVIDSDEIEIVFVGKSNSIKIAVFENGVQTYFFMAPIKT